MKPISPWHHIKRNTAFIIVQCLCLPLTFFLKAQQDQLFHNPPPQTTTKKGRKMPRSYFKCSSYLDQITCSKFIMKLGKLKWVPLFPFSGHRRCPRSILGSISTLWGAAHKTYSVLVNLQSNRCNTGRQKITLHFYVCHIYLVQRN